MTGLLSVVGQALPPIQPDTGFDLVDFLVNAGAALLWSAVAAMIFSLVIIVAMRIFSALTPGVNEIDELKKGNTAVALVMFGFTVSVSAVVVAVLLK
jgi:uncharacterized membrane protein YjfL (UPF0719 family)